MPVPPLRRAALLIVGVLVCALAVVPFLRPEPAQAADLTKFNPGYIISDTIFYDSSTMSAAGIQSFLNAKAPSCVPGADGTPCLKNFRQTTWTRPADARCLRTYEGAADETAAQIIAKVAQACGINPRVILVMLQKEQSLVTASGSSLYANRYRSAMGFGCPDTSPCDAQFYGFFNQVYSAAARFHYYRLNPTQFSHRAGMTNNVRYHPDTACGSSPVFIQNQATAGLYNYTPYQPNAAALAAGYGTGDACSAYGNRNFYNYFSDWFGNPTGVSPTGFIDRVTATADSVTATGWALDPDTRDPIGIHMYLDGASQAFVADQSRPDVDAALGKGPNHGFSATMPATPGPHRACVWAINSDYGTPNTLLGCRDVTVVDTPPTGYVDSITTTSSSITGSGWALDPDTNAPVSIEVTVDGGPKQTFTADASRPDIDAVFHRGANHGFTFTVPATTGQHTVCIAALNANAGPSTAFGCRTVTVSDRSPTGFIDSVTATSTTITAAGWALDLDTNDPISIQVALDGGAPQTFLANTSRPDLDPVFHRGTNHGFTVTLPASAGQHSVCITALNAGAGPATPFGCRTVSVGDRSPTGFIDSVTASATSITASGWAIDLDTNDPISIQMAIDGGTPQTFLANTSRPDLDPIFHKGTNHGYTATVMAAPGQHTVCITALNSTPGPSTAFGCRTVTVG